MKIMPIPRLTLFGYDLWVILGIFLLAVVLGVLNNFRVYEEQRVNLFGDDGSVETEIEEP